MRSLPRLIEINEIYALKGDQWHYFDPKQMQAQYGLKEYVSPGKQFDIDDLSSPFETELKYFYQYEILKENSQSWALFNKEKKWIEYVIHTLYEITEEEIKEEQEEIRKQQVTQKERQKNLLYQIQNQTHQREIKENVDQLNYLLLSEESTQQDEILSSENQDNQSYVNNYTHNQISVEVVSQQNSINQCRNQLQRKSNQNIIINSVKHKSDIARQSTRATFKQMNNLRLRDMVFKGYNCGEICFSPFEVFLEYLNSITEEYQQPPQDNPEIKYDKLKGFMQLITFKKELSFGLTNIKDQEQDYTNLLTPEK